MKVHLIQLGVATTFIVALQYGSAFASSSFAQLEYLSGGPYNWSEAFDVSGDGSTIGGRSSSSDGDQAVYWNLLDQPIILEKYSVAVSWAYVQGANYDGTVLVGVIDDPGPGDTDAFRWTAEGGFQILGHLPGGESYTEAWGVSPDGNVVVGYGVNLFGEEADWLEAFRWTEETGIEGLGFLPGGGQYSVAYRVSGDGSTIVGESDSYNSWAEAFYWTEESGMVGLGFLPGVGNLASAAYSANSDGSVIVGSSGGNAFRWEKNVGMQRIGDLDGGRVFSVASDVSADGNVIVGYSDGYNEDEAFRWVKGDPSGMRSVQEILTSEGVDMSGWHLYWATAVSDDGQVIAGVGYNPNGKEVAWRAVTDVGLIGVDDFAGSFASAANALHAAHWSVNKMLRSEVDIDKHVFNQDMGQMQPSRLVWSSLPQGPLSLDGNSDTESLEKILSTDESPSSQMNLWGIASTAQFDDGVFEQDHLSGAFGLTRQTADDLRLGFGFHFGEHDLSMDGDEAANSERESWGLNVSGAFEPKYSHLRLYTNVAAVWFEDDIERRYLNGATPVMSEGQREGLGYGASVTLGWEIPVRDNAGLMPFLSYDAIKIELDGYAETGGPFPAEFDEVKETTRTSRVGAELKTNLSDALSLWSSASWAHRFNDQGLTVSGYLPELDSDFAFGGTGVKEGWAEMQVGVIARVNDRLRLTGVLDVANDTDEDVSFGGSLGFSLVL